MSKQNKTLVIITETYPYIGGEQFLYNEFIELSKAYQQVIFFPLNAKDNIVAPLPDNVSLNKALIDFKSPPSNKLLVKHWLMLVQIMGLELFKNRNGSYFFKRFAYHLSAIKQAIQLKTQLETELKHLGIDQTATYMSTWMNIGALALSIAKYKGTIDQFSFRVNGFDIFDDRREGQYMPFQVFNYKMANHVIVLSKAGHQFISKKHIYPEKLSINYSGLYERGVNPIKKDGAFHIVSCGNLIPLKRIEYLAKAIHNIEFELKWTHFGDGPEMAKIQKLTEQLPKHINVILKGSVTNAEIISFYQNDSINLFIHPSETEGLGMAIIEAQSFGIPAIGCNTGGVPEIINENTGSLLPVDISPDDLSKAISDFESSKKNTTDYRNGVKAHFLKQFSIEENIIKLINTIES